MEVGVAAVRLGLLGGAVALAAVGADLALVTVCGQRRVRSRTTGARAEPASRIAEKGRTGLAVGLALGALEARVVLSTDADVVADLDVLNVLADADRLADDLVADDLGVVRLAPAARSGVQVRSADLRGRGRSDSEVRSFSWCETHAAVHDLDVDIVIGKGLGLVLLPPGSGGKEGGRQSQVCR